MLLIIIFLVSVLSISMTANFFLFWHANYSTDKIIELKNEINILREKLKNEE